MDGEIGRGKPSYEKASSDYEGHPNLELLHHHKNELDSSLLL